MELAWWLAVFWIAVCLFVLLFTIKLNEFI